MSDVFPPRVRLTALATVVILVLGLMTASFRLGTQSAGITLPEDFEVLSELYSRIQLEAVEAPGDRVLLEGAMRGMVESIGDPHAVYYDPEAFSSFEELLDGTFSGVGLMLEESPSGLTIVRVLPGTPAEAAGVRVGERIVSVNGEDTRELPVSVVVGMVTGPEGTPVRLGLESDEGVREVEMLRARIDLPNVEAEMLDPRTGYVQLIQFSEGSATKVRAAIDELIAQGAEGLVFDLRGNPGGLLREAVRVASLFIDEGPIVSVEEREGEREVFEATGEAVTDLPLVVLVDEGSASASEIVAGALQDHGRAQLVGEKTFGKATVQAVRMLSDGSGVKFTTARYYTPSGRSVADLVPDREVIGEEAQLAAAREVLTAVLAGR